MGCNSSWGRVGIAPWGTRFAARVVSALHGPKPTLVRSLLHAFTGAAWGSFGVCRKLRFLLAEGAPSTALFFISFQSAPKGQSRPGFGWASGLCPGAVPSMPDRKNVLKESTGICCQAGHMVPDRRRRFVRERGNLAEPVSAASRKTMWRLVPTVNNVPASVRHSRTRAHRRERGRMR